MTPHQALGYATELLKSMADERDDDLADPETRSLRYAARRLEQIVNREESMPRGRHGASIGLRNNENEGFASVSESSDGDVTVEIGIKPEHVGRLTILVNEERVALLPQRDKEDA